VILGLPEDLQPVRLDLFGLGCEDGKDGDPFDLEIGLGPDHVTDLGLGIEELGIEDAARLERTGGAPGPGPVVARACQLDVNPACHRYSSYNGPGTLRAVRSEPVLLVHGFASSFERNWREPGWVDLLQESGRQVIGVDLLGHGTAERPHDPAAYSDLEECVRRALPADGAVDAVGFSLGGQLLLAVAAAMPERFGRIVVGGVGANLFASSDSDAVALAIETGEPDPENGLARAFTQFAAGSGNDPLALAACLRRPSRRVTAADLATLRRPVLVVLGDRDFAGPPDPLMAALPEGRLTVLPGADHFGTPKDFRFIDAALEFLEAVPA
jgi:pimeloyl-ACP methyl ester carboxylesterase